MYLNRQQIIGNLTADAEKKETKDGQVFVTFSVATNYSYKKGDEKIDEPEFHNCVVYGTIAGSIASMLKKGKKVFAEGRTKTTKVADKNDSARAVYYRSIICDKIIILDKKETTGVVNETIF